jgi:hypothetical protein
LRSGGGRPDGWGVLTRVLDDEREAEAGVFAGGVALSTAQGAKGQVGLGQSFGLCLSGPFGSGFGFGLRLRHGGRVMPESIWGKQKSRGRVAELIDRRRELGEDGDGGRSWPQKVTKNTKKDEPRNAPGSE